MRTNFKMRVSLIAALLALTAFTLGSQATAATSGQTADPKAEQSSSTGVDDGGPQVVSVVSAYTDSLHALIDRENLSGLGYIRVTDTDTDRHVDVWWKGQVPDSVKSLVSDWPFKVNFLPAQHTLQEVNKAEAMLSDIVQNLPFEVKGFSIAADGGDAIDVQVPARLVGTARTFLGSATKMRGVGYDSSVPLRGLADDSKAPTPAGRAQDTEPFYGGSYIDIDGDGDSAPDCTSGFSVYRPGTTYTGLLTARHCGLSKCWTTLADLRIGCTGDGVKKVDSIIISGKSYAPRVFDDQTPYPSNLSGASVNDPVVGARNPDQGERICLSGAFSGVECSGAYVLRTGVYWQMVGYGTYEFGPGFKVANDLSGRVHGFAGPGDSGGPVFATTKDANNNTQIRARGIITAVDGDMMKCPGYEEGDNRYCSVGVWVMNIADIESQQNVKVMLN
jgi:hypothetical protein